MNQDKRQCIYCSKIAEKAFFNTEHIVPYSMIQGKSIQKNITLTPSLHKYCVCQVCNSYFDKEFDRFLGRDSIDALLRSEHGLLKAGTTIGKSSRLSIQTTDGSRISISQESTEKVARCLPQIRVLNKATQEYNYLK